MADDKTTPQVWQFKNVLRVLNSYVLPTGKFDPAGAWSHTYNIHFLNIREGKAKAKKKGKGGPTSGMPRPDGILKVASAPKGNEIELLIESSALMDNDLTTARIRCKNDRLCTPLSWDIRFTNQRESGQKLVTFFKTGAVEKGVLLKEGKPAKGIKRLEAYTSDWSLFDAVQRLGRDNFSATLTCDLLEYLDVLRENQTVKFRGQTQVACSGANVDAREYLQFGEGVLPTHYYLDADNRLFMVLGSRRLFVLVNEKV